MEPKLKGPPLTENSITSFFEPFPKEQCQTVPPCSYLHGRPGLGPSCTAFSTLDAGILIMVQQVRLIMFSLNMLDYSMSFLSLSTLIFSLRTN